MIDETIQHKNYWLKIDTLYIAGPFWSTEDAFRYLKSNTTDQGFIRVYLDEEESLMMAEDVVIDYDRLATLSHYEQLESLE